ncbi:MAG: hypothetical protein RJB66_1026 [Pseudomonadota bacterium]
MKTLLISIGLSLFSLFAFGQDRYTETLRSSYTGILKNLNHPNITPGAVIASPSQQNPNYFYHWVRDAGLTMMELVELYKLPLRPERKQIFEHHIKNWISFEMRNQHTAIARSNLGEPIFTVGGDIYPFPWGRPQSDGPAIRALAMINYAEALISEGRLSEVNKLYRAELPTTSPIKRDLEYISHHWQEQSFDLWEEVKGLHFFTRMAQRSALIRGAQLAEKLKDPKAAHFYIINARELEKHLLKHRSEARGYIVPTIHQTDGWQHKKSEIDISVLLGVIYFSLNDGFFDLNDPWVLATAKTIESTFASLYKINQYIDLAPAIGRYPEDVYTGSGFGEGNPWFLATNAFAEYYCQLSKTNTEVRESKQLRDRGLSFMTRTIFHSDAGGRMPEQFNRDHGFTQGAKDLTWSYTSYVRAYRRCDSNSGFMAAEQIDLN